MRSLPRSHPAHRLRDQGGDARFVVEMHPHLEHPRPFAQPGEIAFLARQAGVVLAGGDQVERLGIGRLKRDLLPAAKGPVAMAMMHSIKQAMDPNGILNPGKMLRS